MNNIVKIKLIEKKGSQTFNGFVRYKNTKDYITPYYTKSGVIYTGLTEDEAKYFGEKLQKDLNPLSDFWHSFSIIMTDKVKELDLSNVTHQLEYKFLQNHVRIASDPTDPNIGIKDYVILDENKEAEVINKRSSAKRKANQLFDKLSTDNKKDILRLYPGFTSMDTVSSEIIDARLYEKLEENPEKFIAHAEDKKRDMKVMLKDLVATELLRKNKSSYYYGEDFLGHDEESTIEYLSHPDHQALKIDLIKQLEAKRK